MTVKLQKLAKKNNNQPVLYKNGDGDTLMVTPSFTYEIQIFKFGKKISHLMDTTTSVSKTKLTKLEIWEDHIDGKIKKEYTLIGASEKWLKENKYEKVG